MRANNKKTGAPEQDAPRAEQSASLSAAVEQMRMLRTEHRPILQQIINDPGMAAETRQALIGHLQSEEDEKLARIAQMISTSDAPRAGRSAASNVTTRQFSVGSLRMDPPALPVARGSVGSLRQNA